MLCFCFADVSKMDIYCWLFLVPCAMYTYRYDFSDELFSDGGFGHGGDGVTIVIVVVKRSLIFRGDTFFFFAAINYDVAHVSFYLSFVCGVLFWLANLACFCSKLSLSCLCLYSSFVFLCLVEFTSMLSSIFYFPWGRL